MTNDLSAINTAITKLEKRKLKLPLHWVTFKYKVLNERCPNSTSKKVLKFAENICDVLKIFKVSNLVYSRMHLSRLPPKLQDPDVCRAQRKKNLPQLVRRHD